MLSDEKRRQEGENDKPMELLLPYACDLGHCREAVRGRK